LVDSTEENTAEKDSLPNLSLRGYEIIDHIKEKLENKCPGVVSCADLLAMAAREAISFVRYIKYSVNFSSLNFHIFLINNCVF